MFTTAFQHALCAACCLYVATCVVVAPQQTDIGAHAGERDLAFVHVPYNFGHTVEMHAYFSKIVPTLVAGAQTFTMSNALMAQFNKPRAGGELWAKLDPDLLVKSEVTGCPLYFTPPKLWPKEVAEKHFKGRQRFGLLRDPAERLVAMFRGSMPFYGGGKMFYRITCDVDAGVADIVKEMLKGRETPDDKKAFYGGGCTRLQQAEYFEGEYGIQLAVDNRAFPNSVNKLLKEHGYIKKEESSDPWYIEDKRILHVMGCDEVGTWNLTAATRQLIREAYPKDYALLCEKFGYCEEGENTCLTYIDQMCPSWVKKEELRAKLTSK